MKKLLNLTLRAKLIGLLAVVVTVPLAINSTYAYRKSSDGLQREVIAKLEAARSIKADAVKRYFENAENMISTCANDITTVTALKEFRDGFYNLRQDRKLSAVDLIAFDAAVKTYYDKDFSAEYEKQLTKKPELAQVYSKLDTHSKVAQYTYIASNSNPLGSKHKLDRQTDESRFSKSHGRFHPVFREYLTKFSLYDIFLIDESGRIVYTVFKELDFSTSLAEGPYASTNLGEAYRRASTAARGTSILTDYKQYFPSYEAPASFIASPVFDGDKRIGVVAFQMPLDRLSNIMAERSGMGTSGETFLVGPDFLLRSDTFLNKDVFNVVNSFRNPDKASVRTPTIEKALNGEAGHEVTKSYAGVEVISSYAPFKVGDTTWAFVANLSVDEALEAAVSLRNAMMWIAGLTLVIGMFVAYVTSSRLSSTIEKIAHRLQESADLVSVSSREISSVSGQLSEAATEQASSLQETVSSINEISSMVKRNAQAAESSTLVSGKSRQAASAGKETVEIMMKSIGEVAQSNEVIMKQMLESNQNISEIVRVISEIGEKTKVINDIVFQTKLLSFNASVEAARAGEHGKGFAVVAEEVGNLASMSGEAAKEITGMLDSSVQRVSKIVEETRSKVSGLVEMGKAKVEQGIKTAKACGEALDEILKHASSVNDLVSEISVASKEQAQGVEEVNKAMSQLDQVTQQNTSVAQESAQMSARLNTQAVQLRGFVHELEMVVKGDDFTSTHSSNSQGTPAPSSDSKQELAKVLRLEKRNTTKKGESDQSLKMDASGTSVPKEQDRRFEEV
jgi:methyl-accepting chemotaxis protein